MKKIKTYAITLILCSIILLILLCKNYIQINRMKEKQLQLYLIQEETKNIKSSIKKFGYGDILKALDFNGVVKVERFNQQKEENLANVNIQVSGDIIKINEILENIRNKENFKTFNNIRLEKDNNIINTKVNVDFIKNK